MVRMRLHGVKKLGILALLVVFVLLISSLSFFRSGAPVQAQKALFFPEVCLGGWQQPQNAAGAPQLELGQYTATNSAVYTDNNAAIFCGQFAGELPPQTYHTRVTLRFSWQHGESNSDESQLVGAVEGQGVFEELLDTLGFNREATGDHASSTGDVLASSTVDVSASSTAEELASSTDAASPIVQEPENTAVSDGGRELVTDEISPTLTEEVSQTGSESIELLPVVIPLESLSGSEFIPTPDERDPSSVEVSPAQALPIESSERTESEPTAWYYQIMPFVYAEEDFGGEVATIDEARDATTTLTSDVTQAGGDALFVIEYTLDGAEWHHIGFVKTINNDVRFEIPTSVIESVSDISRVQVAIRPLLQFDTIEPVYLDALWLEISYAPVRELGVHRISTIVPEAIPLAHLIVASSSEITAVTASSSLLQQTPKNFGRAVTFVRGVSDAQALAGVVIGTSTELWLFDFARAEFYRIGYDEARISSYPIATKDGMIFWLNYDGSTIFTYDLRTAGRLHEMHVVANLPDTTEHRFTFPFTDWQLIQRDAQFYFYTSAVGEISQDENALGAQQFFIHFSLPTFLTPEELHAVGGVLVPSTEVKLVDEINE